ncbi:NB-ARC domain containing protein [Trema orientale]|uniref:NB-ARC domain containing protein n=1 Tax=Trema orientale TaxID=63057 RepID=A0A2P5EN13_TREOI|nr:NB-ARC domain containing protein [Trema orientale]
MAIEMVVGAFLSSYFDFVLEKIASSPVLEFLTGKKDSGFDGLLRKLKTTFLCLAAVLVDADQKQVTNPLVKEWLDELQDAVDDAEDLFGEIEYDALKLKAEADSSTGKRKASEFFSSIFNSTDQERKTKMEEILEKLEHFEKQRYMLDLKEDIRKIPSRRQPSTSLVDESEVYGRDDEKDVLRKTLLSDEVGSEKICVIPIVGMGGIGKTTLAQAVYNDDKVEEYFELKSWVCVSEEFDVREVMKTVYEAVTGEACFFKHLDRLQVKIRDTLRGKKFLIILDDVWNEDPDFWNMMRLPFKEGAQGSKIIVTTRSKKVASIMRTVEPRFLEVLKDEACWKLFEKHASGGEDFTLNPDLERIGREIVEKCKGLPLAVKTLAGLLRFTLDIGEWRRIAESDVWDLPDEGNNILPALRLSYYYLPSHLKKCFAYCSIFPKDYVFEKEELIKLWMAENLVEHPRGQRTIEDVGNEYFKDLASRSFFQQLMTNYKYGIFRFVMHDLMVDLAKSISGKYCRHLLESKNSDEIGTKTRHLSLSMDWHDPRSKRFNYDFEVPYLRTFLVLRNTWRYPSLGEAYFSEEEVKNLLKLKRLRVLSFKYSGISELPNTIGELRHLRSLDLSHTSIKKLPESVSLLFNLEMLMLCGCKDLKTLPKDIHHLIKLKYLDIRDCYSLEKTPSHVSKIRSFQTNIFIVGKDSGAKIGELRELSSLRGELSVKHLENVVNVKDESDQANLKDKKHLEQLRLEWNNDSGIKGSTDGKGVLDMLSPSIALKELEIIGYPGTTFSNWVGDGSLIGNIVYVELSNCRNCLSLPPLGQLLSLKILIISGFDKLETVGPEFYGNGSVVKPFPSLESLEFSNMSSWKTWASTQVEDAGAFEKLKVLQIVDCHDFIGDLSLSLPSLTTLQLISCKQFGSSLPKMPCVSELEFWGCEKLVSLSDIGQSHVLTSLSSLTISGCPEMETFPGGGLPFSLSRLYISNCPKLITSRMTWNLQSLPALTSLTIEAGVGNEDVESFPEQGLLPPTLTELRISGFRQLRALDKNGLQQLPCLKQLHIRRCPELQTIPEEAFPPSLEKLDFYDCPKLQRMPEEGLPTSLKNFEFFGCPLLSEMCLPENGEYWSKIRHIPNIRINRVRIKPCNL